MEEILGTSYHFRPGEFIRYISSKGDVHIGCISSVSDYSVTVQQWIEDDQHCLDQIFLPPFFVPSTEIDVIPMPRLSSIIFMVHHIDIDSCKVRFAHGMQYVVSTETNYVQWHNVPQSLSSILFHGISAIACELERIISNRRMKLECLSLFTVQACELTWRYVIEILQLQEHQLTTVTTFSKLSGRDLSTTQVKIRTPCKAIRMEDNNALLRVVALFGVSLIVGIRKRPPKVARLKQHDVKASSCEGVLSTDAINLVDTTGNEIVPQRAFQFNAQGQRGTDFMFYPDYNKIKIAVRYSSYVLASVKPKLLALNILQPQQPNPGQQNHGRLTDNELQMLLSR
jgi:hypothetical protein